MATPQEKLAQALETLHALQEQGHTAIKTTEITRTQRERLVKHGFIREVIKGWYMQVNPEEKAGDSTAWYSNFWAFCSRFLYSKYGDNWIISADQSLLLHAGNHTVPTQLLIKSPEATNYNTDLPNNTSLFGLQGNLPGKEWITELSEIRMYTLPASLVYCSATIFRKDATDARTALSLIKDASQVLAILLEGGHSVIAGRLAGAFRNMGRDRIANEIIETMRAAGYDVRENDPFDSQLDVKLDFRERSPYGNRIRLMWQQMREVVLTNFPKVPGIPKDYNAYLLKIEKLYITDAYHSLSIERYRVSPQLIESVRKGDWDFQANEVDKQQRDAMAARGYWQAFQLVEKSIKKILQGGNAGEIADADHGAWYRELFGPSVTAGLLRPADLAGYRNGQVYIGGSKHVPLNVEAVRDTMPVFFELLAEEPEAAVRAVLSHFIFVFIHPYMDGNGRMGRFLMNVMLASGGYPWTVIPVERRDEYMKALDKASAELDIEPFSKFLGQLVNESLKGKPEAKI